MELHNSITRHLDQDYVAVPEMVLHYNKNYSSLLNDMLTFSNFLLFSRNCKSTKYWYIIFVSLILKLWFGGNLYTSLFTYSQLNSTTPFVHHFVHILHNKIYIKRIFSEIDLQSNSSNLIVSSFFSLFRFDFFSTP